MRNSSSGCIRVECDMEFVISAVTDVGTTKAVNQDCIFAEQFTAPIGKVAFSILCDGMGGLQHGEVASSQIVSAFARWAHNSLPALAAKAIEDHDIRTEWTDLILRLNGQIRQYGLQGGFSIGSTVTALLMTEQRYYILNIGDSRAYEIGPAVKQITEDHTVVANEVRLGNLTPEQAESSPIKNVLTKCVGATDLVYPDLYFGTPQKNAVYMLCSDGFRHHVSPEEFRHALLQNSGDQEQLTRNAAALVELNKQRGETDNISVIAILVK